MKKLLLIVIALCLLVIPSAVAETIPEDTLHALVHEALLSDCNYDYYMVEAWTEGHHILGTEIKGDTARVYVEASVAGYGFFGGGFVNVSGWYGPCTVVLEKKNGAWRLDELLVVEDYNEIPDIMPKKYENLFFADHETTIEAQKEAQAQAYLDSIGRTEKIYWHTTEVGELEFSNPLADASRLRMNLDEMYPYALTTAEYLIDGERYFYTRQWEKAPDAPDEVVLEANGLQHHLNGTLGTETLIKTTKDGQELERITMVVELDKMTITCADLYGSVEYVFIMGLHDGFFGYEQPTITRMGDCRVDTADFDEAWRELPGKAVSETAIASQIDVSDSERFTLYRDGSAYTLAYSRLENGAWQEHWRNEQLIPLISEPVNMRFTAGTNMTNQPRYDREETDLLCLSAGEEHPSLWIEICRVADGWKVNSFSSESLYCFAALFDDYILFNAADFSALQTANFYLGAFDRDASSFSAEQLDRLKYETNVFYDTPEIKFFAHAEPLYMNLKLDVNCPVYARPDENSPRPAKGKASVSLNDWAIAICREGDWLFILYETSGGKYRAGWIDSRQHEALKTVQSVSMDAVFAQNDVRKLTKKTSLYDDMINGSGQLLSLSKGTEVTVLWEDEALEAVYVEVKNQNKLWRGFVDPAAL